MRQRLLAIVRFKRVTLGAPVFLVKWIMARAGGAFVRRFR